MYAYKDIFLTVFSFFSIICGILVLVSKNPIISILFLIGLFLSISIYLLLAGISFIGISYLVVYIGAVSILFLFILMLINIRTSELVSNTWNSIPLAIIVGLLYNYSINSILPSTLNTLDYKSLTNYSTNELYFVTSDIWDSSLIENSHITSIGNIMYTSHSIWLILTSMILLLAMVGCIVITFKQKNY
jgi:NADH-ubiquinone oxidoreductase chain 6